MTLNIRNKQADALARELAELDGTTITDAVVNALRETIANRLKNESPRETARRILARRGLAFKPSRQPVPAEAFHELDHEQASD
ncbi:type II toxin-antitoxin system VapB family antitoxin [Rhizobium halophilum]|uniref:type II toxin-antitoxin system VapB family antitoxin n=1 Tax=Rhizobium halophilum TaxID=2846852 RepID=UPI001EFEA622|nr:type II toxin-antitoxin system VapB family antitoxin [Rhizobium halophilum]MCF6367838.1 type II toxin-antitoxin system VapB family antitoxin [Rhizobium halophilum]